VRSRVVTSASLKRSAFALDAWTGRAQNPRDLESRRLPTKLAPVGCALRQARARCGCAQRKRLRQSEHTSRKRADYSTMSAGPKATGSSRTRVERRLLQHPRRHAMLLRKRARLRSARLPATGEVKHLGSTIVLCLHPTPPAQESSQPTSYGTTVFVERYAVAKYFRTGDRANRQPLQCI